MILNSTAKELTTGTAIRGVTDENIFFSIASPAYFSKDDFLKNKNSPLISDKTKQELSSLDENANPVILLFEYQLK